MSIHVAGLVKGFHDFKAIDDVTFSVADGEFVALLGPSGSGKSTVLRCIAGLETPDSGRIEINGDDVTRVPVQNRKVGFVFQHYALFRHMNVIENISFGLTVRGIPKSEREAKARELLALIGLEGYEKRMPRQLSGGQRQRVALARALAPEPRLLLLDEPFAALDMRLRKELRVWLRKLHDRIKLTTLLVTHDQVEAFELADRVLVVNHGRVDQDGTPEHIFTQPATEFVAGFVGETNRIEGKVSGGAIAWGPLTLPAPDLIDGTDAVALFRPFDVYVSSRKESSAATGVIRSVSFLGAFEELSVELDGGFSILAQVPKGVARQSGFTVGKTVHVEITSAHIFRKEFAYPETPG